MTEPADKLLDLFLLQASKDGASDLRLLIAGESCRPFACVAGELKELKPPPPPVMCAPLAQAARRRGGLSTTEKGMPQTGVFDFELGSTRRRVRVVSAPSAGGETLVFSFLT